MTLTPGFQKILAEITSIGLDWHSEALIENSKRNKPFIAQSIKDIAPPQQKKAESAIVISAGPSLYKNNILTRIKDSGYQGTIVAIDGSYVRCLKAGLQPDYLLTLDPHPTRIVRWFGDPDFEANMAGDDYFSRQDLDIAFRNNSVAENRRNIELVNQHGKGQKLVICSSAPSNVVERVNSVGFDAYWWAPLVDSPAQPDSLTRAMVKETGLPAMNTGGTVGTAAWVFALTVLKIPRIAVVGMDLGYYKADTGYELTQTYGPLRDQVGEDKLQDVFPEFRYPGTDEVFYTDPTYYWYRSNLLDLLAASKSTLYNCTGGGTLFGDGVVCTEIDEFCAGY
ncbi:MAG: 6-hydroxymethylpterin diphosphokinase MptE-like protein [Methylobacter sp.]